MAWLDKLLTLLQAILERVAKAETKQVEAEHQAKATQIEENPGNAMDKHFNGKA